MEHSRANSWLIEQNRLWRELASSTITGWLGLESNTGDDAMISFERGVAFQELAALRVERGDAEALDFGIYQNDDVFGLSLSSVVAPLHGLQWHRPADLAVLPTGKVNLLEARTDDRTGSWGDLIEVRLSIGGREVLVVAAEVAPTDDGLSFVWSDESLFVFSDPSQANSVNWAYERKFSTRVVSPDTGEMFDM